MHGITFLPTCDLAATNAFYHDVLDLEPALDQETCIIYRVGGAFWGFCESETGPVQPEQVILTLVADDVDGWYDLFVEAGIPCDAPPRENAKYRIYHFFAADPNGYRIEVQRFLHPFG
jgi:catechol 2,3-dioxygenase-like lactoylglutathione lyase family enzyme